MNESGYTIAVPIQINGGNGAPTELLDRELYIDTTTGNLYYGRDDGSGKVKVKDISIKDLSALVSNYLSGNNTKVINNVNLSNVVIGQINDSCVVKSLDELSDSKYSPGLYIIDPNKT